MYPHPSEGGELMRGLLRLFVGYEPSYHKLAGRLPHLSGKPDMLTMGWFGNRRLRGYSGADNAAAEMPDARGTEVCHCTL